MQTSLLCTLQQKAQYKLSWSNLNSNNAFLLRSASYRTGCIAQGSSSTSSFGPHNSSSSNGSWASPSLRLAVIAHGYRQPSALDSSEDLGVSAGPGHHSQQHKKAKQQQKQKQQGHPSGSRTGSLDEPSSKSLGKQQQGTTAADGAHSRTQQPGTKPRNGHSSAPGSHRSKAGQRVGKARAAATAATPPSTEGASSSRPSQAGSASSVAGSTAASFPIGTLKSPFFNVRFKTFQQLQHLVCVHGCSARIADLTAMMSRLKYVDEPSTADRAALLQDMWHLLARQLHYAAARHCAEAMLTASKLGSCPDGLYEACIQQTVLQIETAEARILSNAIYAVAIAHSGSVPAASLQQVWDVLLPAFMRVVPDANSQSVANVAYALAVLSQSNSSSISRSSGGSAGGGSSAREQLQALLQAVKPSLWAAASPQETSNTLWAAGTLGAEVHPELLQLLLARVLSAAGQASAQDITNSVYGVTLLQQRLHPQQHEVLTCALLQKQPDAQAISGFLWSTAKMGLQLQQQQVDTFISQLLQSGEQLVPQAISLSLWGVANLERSLHQAALLQLLQHLAAARPAPQALGLSLWAAAKLRAEVPTALLDQLYQQLASVAEQADPQSLSNALWAAAVMLPQPYVPTALIGDQAQPHQQQQPKQKQKGPVPGGKKKVKHRQRLQQQALAVFVSKVSGMKPLELSNVALALALLGFKQMDILQPVYEAALRYLDSPESSPAAGSRGTGSSSSSWTEGDGSAFVLGPQALSNLAWAGAILDLREHQEQLRRLAQACAESWGDGQHMGPAEEGVQLYQVHLWLTELVGAAGLEGVLTPEQLQRCKESLRSAASVPSFLQHQVYQAALTVPGLQDVQLEAVTADGLMSVDIAAVLATGHGEEGAVSADALMPASSSCNPSGGSSGSSGVAGTSSSSMPASMQLGGRRVAIEVDGPWHWRRADMRPTGPSTFRNRLLAHRGYTVVTVPFFEWQGLKEHEQAAYLQQAIEQQMG